VLWLFPAAVVLVPVAAAFALRWQVADFDRATAARRGEELASLRGRRILAVVAHPDDLEYYAGGTLARLVDGGAEVVAVIATNGEKGGRDPDLARLRQEEQRRAGTVIGYREMRFLGLPDRGVRDDAELRSRLSRILGEVNPDLVFTFDDAYPLLPYIHPDHQSVAAATQAVWEGKLLLFHTRRPDLLVDVSGVAPRKVAALACHVSQGNGHNQRLALRALLALARPLRPVLAPAFSGEGTTGEEWFRTRGV